jgi:2-polyprenyl-3-methyl-5-hydroxy-6-metoxy-1,4-benzoquinol methylase/glycosyltransferase involved in cell wall biosynthesis
VLRWSEGTSIWRCARSAFDFVHPKSRPPWVRPAGGQQVSANADPPPWFIDLLAARRSQQPAPSLLDFGCGGGHRLGKALELGWQVLAVEPSRPDREAARAAHPDAYVAATIEEIPPHRFDLIVLFDGIHWHTDPYAVFHELFAKDAIGPETVLVVTTPNARARTATENPMLWGNPGYPQGVSFFSAASLAELLQQLRFRHFDITGLDGDGASEDGTELLTSFRTLWCRASGSDFAAFMRERYVPGTWSELAAYEHLPRYAFAARFARGKRVLDFGCGAGYGSALLAEFADSVVGLDISGDALSYARSRYRHDTLSFVQDACFGASLPSASFDLIVCFEMIEHIDSPAQIALLEAFRRLLVGGGRLLISTPNPNVTRLYGDNPFHQRELRYPEFEALLRAYFPHVELLAQTIQASVILRPLSRPAIRSEIATEADTEAVPSEPAAYLAICGDEPILPPLTMIYPDAARGYIDMRLEALKQRNIQLIARHRYVQLVADLQRTRRDAAHRQQQLAETHAQEMRRAQEALQRACAQLDGLRAQDQERRASLAESQQRIAQLTAASNRADAELVLLRQEIAAVSAREEEALAALEGARQELGRFRTSLDEANAALTNQGTELSIALQQQQASQAGLAEANAEIAALRDGIERAQAALRDQRAELDIVLQREQESLAALAASRQHIADLHAASGAAHAALSERNARLAAIESSTLWRAARRSTPALRRLRPVLRPILRGAYKGYRSLVNRGTWQSSAAPGEPPAAGRLHRPASPIPRDLAFETRLDPVWNSGLSVYELHYDAQEITGSPDARSRPYAVVHVARDVTAGPRPKVVHIIPNVYVGGSTQLVVDLVQHLSDRFEHEILTSALWPGGAHQGLVVHHVPEVSTLEMSKMLARINPDLVHVHYWGLGDDPWYQAATRAIAGRRVAALQNVNTPIAPLLDRKFQYYVFVSEYVRDTFGAGVVGRVPTRVIYPGIDLSLFATPAVGHDAENAIGMVYRLEDDKLREDSIDLLIEVVRRRPRTKAYIVGGGRFLQGYLERTEAAGLRENFRFTGYVPYDTLPRWYDKFGMFVAPVWRESFGQVVPFAMSKGLVVAGYSVGALPEILGTSETLGSTLDAAASIMVDLLNDRPRMHEIGRRNQSRARALFDVRSMISGYAEIYRELLGLEVTSQSGALT